MDTLIDKVKVVEGDAKRLVEESEKSTKEELSELLASENSIIEGIKKKAEISAKEIAQTKIDNVKSDLEKIKKEEEKEIENVKVSAKKNRDEVVTLATELFKKEYIN